MTLHKLLAAAAASGVLVTTAWSADYQVTRSLQLKQPTADVWRMAGGFCDIDDWHPGFIACEVKAVEGTLHRVLTTNSGETFVDQRIAREPGLSYTYKSVQSQLPVDSFVATFSVEPNDGSQVTWSVDFSSEDPAMEAKVIDLIETGLAGIEDSF